MPENALPASGTVLAFDLGGRRTGAAVGELSLGTAHPLATLEARTEEHLLARVGALVREWTPIHLVVGLPLHMDGRAHPLAKHCRRFAARLGERFQVPVSLVDERLSSHEASLALADAGIRGRRQKGLLDQVSAQVILESFFAQRP